MEIGLDYLNSDRNSICLARRNDGLALGWYREGMATPRPDWYFNEWLAHCDKSQADVNAALEWNKSKTSLFAKGTQRYHRDDINELAEYLNLEPFELLLPPERAMAYRQYRQSAEEIVRSASEPVNLLAERDARVPGKVRRRTGTTG